MEKYIVMGLTGIGLYAAGNFRGKLTGRGEALALLIAYPKVSAKEVREATLRLAEKDGANFIQRCWRLTVDHCDKRIIHYAEKYARKEP